MTHLPPARQAEGIPVSRKAPLPKTSPWRLEFIRLIAFPTFPPVLIEQNWWKDVVIDLPQDYSSVRKLDFRKDQGSVQDKVSLSLSIDLKRVVWEAHPPGVVEQSCNFPTFVGSFREKIAWFVSLLTPWLTTNCPPLLRLAFSAKLLLPTANAKDAYRVLMAHLPNVNLDLNPNDFLLQINRRKEKSDVVNGLAINRLSTWSKMDVEIAIPPGQPIRWPDRCYSGLELDINTAPEWNEILPGNSLAQLFEELSSLGVAIAECGDVP